MRRTTSQEDATLLDVLIDGFEKNEVMDGFHWRNLPMPDEDAAIQKFRALLDDARRWKGEPAGWRTSRRAGSPRGRSSKRVTRSPALPGTAAWAPCMWRAIMCSIVTWR